MKRTKQAYFRQYPTQQQNIHSSGAQYLIGEDVPFFCRKEDYQKMQKQFLDQQVQQKKAIKQSNKNTADQFDQQLLRNNHCRGQLQLQKADRLHKMEKAHDDYNLQAANQRKTKQKQERQRQLQQQRRQLQLLNQRKVKRWIPNQTQ